MLTWLRIRLNRVSSTGTTASRDADKNILPPLPDGMRISLIRIDKIVLDHFSMHSPKAMLDQSSITVGRKAVAAGATLASSSGPDTFK